MSGNYVVELIAEGWSVSEDGARLHVFADRDAALRSGRLMALATKAAGGKADLNLFPIGDKANPIDLDRPWPLTSGG